MSMTGETWKQFTAFMEAAGAKGAFYIGIEYGMEGIATEVSLALAYEDIAALALEARRKLFEEGKVLPHARNLHMPLFIELQQIRNWNVEMPIFRVGKDGAIETLLFYVNKRTDNYKNTHFVPGAQPPERASPQVLLNALGKKLGIQLYEVNENSEMGNVRFLDKRFSADDPVAPTLSLVYAYLGEPPDEVSGATWHRIDDLPDDIPSNHMAFLTIGLRDYTKRRYRLD